ncbi:hypothetical protein [Sinomicrobium oceani]|uniref:hypothetical protein n=1 Tax=Sinomicrobium oceani TaxID=1150368 RepID=UPI00227B1BED|nr:hypothetical protein [Sinomicrobium oceani]
MDLQPIYGTERPVPSVTNHLIAPKAPFIVEVTPQERNILSGVGNLLMKAFKNYDNPDYISALHLHAYQLLPERITRILSRFGTDFSADQYGALIFRGLVEIDQEDLGPTPPQLAAGRLFQTS